MKNITHQTERNRRNSAEIRKMFRNFGGSPEDTCIAILERNLADVPVNKEAVAEASGGATGPLSHLLK